ncbi:MAG: hypothetical protein AAFZ52_14575 [Bacteroidota bacterium]
MKNWLLLFPLLLTLAGVSAQDAPSEPREICYFFLMDISKSAAYTVPKVDTPELRKILHHHATQRSIRFGGLYIGSESGKQEILVGAPHRLRLAPETGNDWVEIRQAQKANRQAKAEFRRGVAAEMSGCYRFFNHAHDEPFTDISDALEFFARFANQASNATVDFRLVILSDMEQDRPDKRSLRPFVLPPNVSVWIIGAPVGKHYDGLFPATSTVEELVDFKAEYFFTDKR